MLCMIKLKKKKIILKYVNWAIDRKFIQSFIA